MRGVSALEQVLEQNRGANLKVFVVWEPVLTTDWSRPPASQTALVPDPRAEHFWDPERKLSAALGGAANLDRLAAAREVGFRMKDVIWDAALVYPPQARWRDPAAALFAPVVKYQAALGAALGR